MIWDPGGNFNATWLHQTKCALVPLVLFRRNVSRIQAQLNKRLIRVDNLAVGYIRSKWVRDNGNELKHLK